MNKKLLFLLALCSVGASLHARRMRVRPANFMSSFRTNLEKYEHVVALMYDRGDPAAGGMKGTIDQLQSKVTYQQAHIVFVLVGMDGPMQEQMAAEFGITTAPAVAIFEQGNVMQRGNEPAIMTGQIGYAAIVEFIDSWLGSIIDEAEREMRAQPREREIVYSYRPYSDPYGYSWYEPWYSGHPYYYWYGRRGGFFYGHRRWYGGRWYSGPGLSIGIGLGGGGYRRGWRGGGWRGRGGWHGRHR